MAGTAGPIARTGGVCSVQIVYFLWHISGFQWSAIFILENGVQPSEIEIEIKILNLAFLFVCSLYLSSIAEISCCVCLK